MRQDKDRSGKWLLQHHGDAILRLGGFDGFTEWKPLQPETVAPRRLPDGLIEVRFPGESEPTLVLVEIETYPDTEVDSQVLEDLMLIAVERGLLPDVVSLILKPRGRQTVTGTAERISRRGGVRLVGSWSVVRLWEQDAERLLASADVGLIPWVPLTRTNLAPDELMARCRQRLFEVPDPADRAGLAVTQILAGLAFPDRRFLSLLGGPQVMIESPVLDEVKEILRQQYSQQYRAEGLAEGRAEGLAEGRLAALRENILAILDARFGMIPPECPAMLQTLSEDSLKASVKLAATCTNLDEFLKQSTSDGPRNQS